MAKRQEQADRRRDRHDADGGRGVPAADLLHVDDAVQAAGGGRGRPCRRRNSEIKVPETGIIIITVNQAGQIFIGRRDRAEASRIAPRTNCWPPWSLARRSNPGARVIVKGDKDAEFGAIADIMDALQ